MRRFLRITAVFAILAGGVITAGLTSVRGDAVSEDGYEVWLIDQSDTVPDGGGSMYIYDGEAATDSDRAVPERIDLGAAARDLCLSETGTAPRRPHMFSFNSDYRRAVIAFVATGHVLVMDAAARRPIRCIDAGEQAHAAMPAPDDSHIVVANQNGKLLQRIASDFDSDAYDLDPAATIDLATCITPNGAPCQDPGLRPDNAPICPIITKDSRLTFVTLRGGGMFVVDNRATPMQIVAEYDRRSVRPNGCGGVETAGKLFVNAGGGTAANPFTSDLYRFVPRIFDGSVHLPNLPEPQVVFSQTERGNVDSHGAVAMRRGSYLWAADRAANKIVVVDTRRDAMVGEIDLVGSVSGDPTPDLLDVSPGGGFVFVTMRGPTPLTGNAPDQGNAVGTSPGVGVVRVEQSGRSGTLLRRFAVSNIVAGKELADPHGLAVRLK